MITAYHRPQNLNEALRLLSQPNTLPLGGGTLLSRPGPAAVEVVDLQALRLDAIAHKGNDLEIGAMVTLQALLESEHCPEPLRAAIKLEAPLNMRNSATLAGTLVACDGRSTVAACLLALDARLSVIDPGTQDKEPKPESVNLGEFLPIRAHGLITAITMPLNVRLAFESVRRTPADKPIVCAAMVRWPSGRTRLVIGGYSKSPTLAMDGTEAEGLESAARNACHEAGDEFGSAEYRMEMAATLARRCAEAI